MLKNSILCIFLFYSFCYEQTSPLGVSHTPSGNPSVQFVRSEPFFLSHYKTHLRGCKKMFIHPKFEKGGVNNLQPLFDLINYISGISIAISLPSLLDLLIPSIIAWLIRISFAEIGAAVLFLTASRKERILR